MEKPDMAAKRAMWSEIENNIRVSSKEEYYLEWGRLREQFYAQYGHIDLPEADAQRLLSLKDRFRGERIFILGNGPSINKTPLHHLKNEFTFGANRIYLLYDRIDWRPSFYTANDWRVVPDNAEEIAALTGSMFFFEERFRPILREGADVYYCTCTPGSPASRDDRLFAYDVSRGYRGAGSVVGTAIQIAYHLGFDPIYLIGCDLGYKVLQTVRQEGVDKFGNGVKLHLTSTADDDPNHFDSRYFGKGRRWHDPNVKRMIEGHRQCRTAIEKAGRSIFNATIGGELEVYERVDFEGLFSGRGKAASKPQRTDGRLLALKDTFRGQRVFIIGNGPSLKNTPLNVLKNEHTFGVDEIYTLYGKIDWKPTFYTAGRKVTAGAAREINAITGSTFFFDDAFREVLREGSDVCYFSRMPSSDEAKAEDSFSLDVLKGIRESDTAVECAIKIAFHLGFDSIYLVGCGFAGDESGVVEKNARYRVAIEAAGRRIFDATEGEQPKGFARRDFRSLFLKDEAEVALSSSAMTPVPVLASYSEAPVVLIFFPTLRSQEEIGFWRTLVSLLKARGYEPVVVSFSRKGDWQQSVADYQVLYCKRIFVPASFQAIEYLEGNDERIADYFWSAELDMAVQVAARSGDAVVQTALRAYVRHVLRLIQGVKPVKVVVNNDTHPTHYVARCCADSLDTPLIHSERSPTVSQWFEDEGFYTHSGIGEFLATQNWEAAGPHEDRGRQIVAEMLAEPAGHRSRDGTATTGGAVRSADRRRRRRLFLPMDNVYATGWTQPDHPLRAINYPLFDTPIAAILYLARIAERLDATLVVKPHPSDVQIKPMLPDDVELFEGDIGLALNEADVVLCFLTKVAFVGLAWSKPVVTLAPNTAALSERTFHCKTIEEIPERIEQALAYSATEDDMTRICRFLGFLDQNYFVANDLSNQGASRLLEQHFPSLPPAQRAETRALGQGTLVEALASVDIMAPELPTAEELARVKPDSIVFGPFGRDRCRRVEEVDIVAEMFHRGVVGTEQARPLMLDVGSCRGDAYGYFADSRWVVHAFEPNPAMFDKLAEKAGQHGVIVNQLAVSDKSGEKVPFYTSPESIGISSMLPFRDSHNLTATVETIRLDDYCRQNGITEVDFLKVDTEGYDLMVLKGLDWDKIRPRAVVCEFENRKTEKLGYTTEDIANFLHGRGYQVFLSEWHPILRYGGSEHRWRAMLRWPCAQFDSDGWGNLIAFRDPVADDLMQLVTRHAVDVQTVKFAEQMRLKEWGRIKEAVVKRPAAAAEPPLRRAVVLGNGPSLTGFDLTRLAGIDAFGMNAAYRHWDRIGWYPAYYSCLDEVLGLSHKDEIARLIRERDRLGIRQFLLRANLIRELGPVASCDAVLDFDALRQTSKRFAREPVTTGSHALIWAAELGYREIVLLGVDANYTELVPGARRGEGLELRIAESLPNPNYFFEDYQRVGDRFQVPNASPGVHVGSWRAAATAVSELGAVVLNGNRNSRVDAFDFCAPEDIFKSGPIPSTPRTLAMDSRRKAGLKRKVRLAGEPEPGAGEASPAAVVAAVAPPAAAIASARPREEPQRLTTRAPDAPGAHRSARLPGAVLAGAAAVVAGGVAAALLAGRDGGETWTAILAAAAAGLGLAVAGAAWWSREARRRADEIRALRQELSADRSASEARAEALQSAMRRDMTRAVRDLRGTLQERTREQRAALQAVRSDTAAAAARLDTRLDENVRATQQVLGTLADAEKRLTAADSALIERLEQTAGAIETRYQAVAESQLQAIRSETAEAAARLDIRLDETARAAQQVLGTLADTEKRLTAADSALIERLEQTVGAIETRYQAVAESQLQAIRSETAEAAARIDTRLDETARTAESAALKLSELEQRATELSAGNRAVSSRLEQLAEEHEARSEQVKKDIGHRLETSLSEVAQRAAELRDELFEKMAASERSIAGVTDERLAELDRTVAGLRRLGTESANSLKELKLQSISLDLLSVLRAMQLPGVSNSALDVLLQMPEFEHGHVLLVAILADQGRRNPKALQGKTLIEIGTTRERQVEQSSTEKLAIFTAIAGMGFTTVDIDPKNTKRAEAVLKYLNPTARAVTMRGEEYLALHAESVDYVYLDAFDFYHERHSEERVQRYRELLQTEINDEECWRMHALSARAIASRMAPGGIVVIDDTWVDPDGTLNGKGKHAVPLLQDSGFEVIARTPHAVALRRYQFQPTATTPLR